MPHKTTIQLVKYGIVGVTHNTIGYLAYLGLTYLGGEPKLVMTLGYAVGVYVSFTLNKSLTFSYTGPNKSAFIRFSIAHVFGYATNFMMLYVLVDKMHYNHAIIQIMAILVVSVLLFTLFKLYVFPASDKSNRDIT
ncbi:MAG: GtrA family protein [Gammaproteobacteria bacterium]|nr:MAG: GtrA family protein [Gammaproteobacteria bacterium]